MIAKSDLVILAISATLLVAGIYRWQSNLSQPSGRSSVAESSRTDKPRTSNTNSLTAKPTNTQANSSTPPVTAIESPVQSNFGDTVQSTGQAVNTQNTSATSSANSASLETSNAVDTSLYGDYTVEPGDSLSRIAINYGTTVNTLRSINNISGSLINVGQNIRYPLPAN
ncbi:LysM peptidoglycan-binding domain-containing protein [Granulosicoccus antarcticus]|uniref:Autolysin n=1 Tax=Granulosicoccus antarcticus IMCC3135 TaxID=1192854 RepID=A0A2Z2NK40_9GAMM|nr:LysM peptidoglycan-binding domain-containing protein [Granulosicoccus antarcticus]ASJ71493.1 Autolysin [Granulosicoccus antarcticus IMCC3135]